MSRASYNKGFSNGTLAALAVLASHGDVGSRAYVEILRGAGEQQVIEHAKKEASMRWSGLSQYIRQREKNADDTAPDGLEGE